MRRQLTILSALCFIDALYFALIGPLLPEFKRELGLSTIETGLLAGTLQVGVLVTTIPFAMLALRIGVKPMVLGALLLLSIATTALAIVDSYAGVLGARALQGVGGSALFLGMLVWVIEIAPDGRRGEMLGVVMGAQAGGSIMGPLIGGAAAALARVPVLVPLAVATLAMYFVTLMLPAPSRAHAPTLGLRKALTTPSALTGCWLFGIPGLVLGAVALLAPLQLDDEGWGAGAIAIVFGVAAGIGVVARPAIGRASDRRGRISTIMVGLLATAVALTCAAVADWGWGVAVFAVASIVFGGTLGTPMMAMLTETFDALGITQLTAVSIAGIMWGIAGLVGASGAGVAIDAGGYSLAYALLTGIVIATALAVARRFRTERAARAAAA